MPGDDNEKAAYTALVMPAGLTFSPASSAARFSTPKGRPRGPFGSPISNNRDTYSTHSGDTYRLWTGRLSGDMNVVAVDADKAATSTQFGLTDLQRQEILTQVNRSNLLPTQHAVVSTAGGWLKGHTRLKPIDCPTTETAFLDSLSLNIAGGIEILEQVSFPIFLIPTGHRGSLVKTTQRQWCRDTDDTLQGVLVTHYKIVIAERCRFYDADHYWPTTGSYPFPFTKIEIPIRETPNLDASLAKTFADNDCASCADIASTPYWAMMLQPPDYKSDVPFSFPVICTDRDGTAYRTSLSMVVAAGIRAFHCTQHYIPNLLTAYLNSTGVTQQVFPNFNGANIAYATSNKPGDAAYPTGEMRWYADAAPSAAYPLVPWSPKMTSAALALSTTAGFSQNGTASSQTFAYSHYYLSAPFDRATRQGQKVVPATPNPDGNKAEIILAAVGATSSLDFYAKLGGGLFQPTTGIGALSRAAGNIFSSGVKATNGELKSIEDMANGTLDALDALADTATLLGAVGLNQIIAPVQNIVQNIASVPKLISQEIGQLPQDIQTVTDTLNTLYTALQAQSLQDALAPLLNTIAPQVAYVRAFVFEQLASNPQYLGALSDVAYLQTLLGNPVVSSLQAQLANSLASRIQSTVTLVDANTPATLVTLNRMRDYLLNAALQSSDMTAPVVLVISAFSADLDSLTVTDAKAKAIADALNADAKTLSDDLLAFQTALQNVLAQSASAYTSVTNAVTQLQAAIQSITDPVGVINSLQQLAALLSNLPDPLTDILNSGAPALQAVIDTATNINKDVTQIFTDFGALVALAGQEPGAVLKAASKDVATELSHIQSTLGSELKLVTTAFGQGANGFKATLTTLEGFYSQFKQKAAQAAGVLNQFLQTVNELKQVRASYDYDTPLKDFDLFIASKGGQPASLSVHTSITVNVPGLSENPPSPDLIVSAAVNNFTLLLIPEFPFLSVGFDSATMTSTNGSTPVVDCKLDGKSVQFVGPMNLVMDLAENIALPGGLSVQQTADGVSVAFSLAVPSIESGAFLMSNLSLYSGVALDFTGQAIKVNFGFADPNHHFVMTYTVFGGGGYLDFQFSPQRGLSAFDISGALEFGAEAALDFGVASGDLYIFGGFLFNMTGDELDLGGYLRAGGDLNVLDLITASVEFSMSLAYENRSGTAWLVGECDITVDVDIAWVIDVSVDLRLHREFCNTSAN
jgi:hypothetical protein